MNTPTYKLKIRVTKDILLKTAHCKGRDNVKNCAIAVAVRDVFTKAYVDSEDIYPFGRRNMLIYSIDLPTKARNFIQKFDAAKPKQRIRMKPISFEISVPDAVIEKINIDELKPLLVNHPTLELCTVA